MLAVGVTRFGGPEQLMLLTLPEPQPGPGEVRVRVIAATVNPADVSLRDGTLASMLADASPPYIGGLEFAGVVSAVGPDASSGPPRGTLVAGLTSYVHGGNGAHAEQLVVPARSVAALPDGLDPARGATVPMNGLTARLAIDRLALAPGAVVAVTGAAGGLGAYVCELAATAGLRVLAVAGEEDASFLREIGVEQVIPRGAGAMAALRAEAPSGVDGLVDAAVLGQSALGALRSGGRMIAVRPVSFRTERGIEIVRVSAHTYGQEQEKLSSLLLDAAGGKLQTRMARIFSPGDVAMAHRLLEQGGLRGRPVLRFASDDAAA